MSHRDDVSERIKGLGADGSDVDVDHPELLHALETIGARVPIPLDELARIRARVLETTAPRPWRRAVRLGAQLAAVFAAGFLTREIVSRTPPDAAQEPGQAIVSTLARAAADESRPAPYALSNIRLVRIEGDVVEIRAVAGADMHLRLGRRDPLLVKEVVLPWLESGSVFERLQAVALTDPAANSIARRALVATMRDDPSIAVQLAAAEHLARVPPSAEVMNAFLDVVRSNASAGTKVLALDYLTNHGVDGSALRASLDAMPSPELQVRARNYFLRAALVN